MHYHYLEEHFIIPFCTDACNQQWCADNNQKYQGWSGCQEGGDYPEWCANCGVFAGGTPECDCQRNNVIVNIISTDKQKCEHGHWIQIPPHLRGL